VYNGRVAEYHTYFVGDEGWGFSLWAHNNCGPTGGAAGGLLCRDGCVYTAQGQRLGNYLENPAILNLVRQQEIVYVTNLTERSALRHALRQSPVGRMPQLRHLVPTDEGGVVSAAARHLRGERRVTEHVTILNRQRIQGHQVEVHVGRRHGPHVHIDRGTDVERYIRLTDADWFEQLPRRVRENQQILDAIYRAAFYGLGYS
jgi:hypothetical protein